jgi:hypothetical protein
VQSFQSQKKKKEKKKEEMAIVPKLEISLRKQNHSLLKLLYVSPNGLLIA